MNLGSIFTGVLLNMYGYLNPAYAEIASRLLFDETPERIPGLPELINLRHRDLMTGDLYDSYARQNGYNDYFQEALFRGTDQLLNPLDGITAWRRKIISEEVLDDIFTKNRYRPETSEIIKKAIRHKGYALVDIFQPCVSYNRVNTFQWFKENTYYLDSGYDPSDKFEAFKKAMENDKFPLGIIYKNEKKTFEELLPVYEKDSTPVIKRIRDVNKIREMIKLSR